MAPDALQQMVYPQPLRIHPARELLDALPLSAPSPFDRHPVRSKSAVVGRTVRRRAVRRLHGVCAVAVAEIESDCIPRSAPRTLHHLLPQRVGGGHQFLPNRHFWRRLFALRVFVDREGNDEKLCIPQNAAGDQRGGGGVAEHFAVADHRRSESRGVGHLHQFTHWLCRSAAAHRFVSHRIPQNVLSLPSHPVAKMAAPPRFRAKHKSSGRIRAKQIRAKQIRAKSVKSVSPDIISRTASQWHRRRKRVALCDEYLHSIWK